MPVYPHEIEVFIGRLVATAVLHARGPIETLLFWVGLGAGILSRIMPEWARAVNDWLSVLFLVSFGSLVLIRLVLAPFWMYRDVVSEREQAIARAGQLERDLKEAAGQHAMMQPQFPAQHV